MRRQRVSFIKLLPVLAVGGSALVFAAPAAHAAGTSGTFTLTSGTLSISQPASASLGSAAVGSLTLSGSLGAVTVTDNRGALTATWTSSVTSTDFTTGGGTTFEKVTAANIAYTAGAATSSTGVGAFVPGTIAQMSNTTAGTAGTWAGTGNNSVTWNPTLAFTLSASQVAGTYTGTVTHSVA